MKKPILTVPAMITAGSLIMIPVWLWLSVVALSSCTGCRTINSTNQIDIATISAAIKGVSRSATLFAVRKEPKSTNYLFQTSVYLSNFTTNSSLDPASLNTFIHSLPFKHLQTAEAQLAVTTILTAYEIYWIRHPLPSVDRNKEFIKYIDALSEGISLGLKDYQQLPH